MAFRPYAPNCAVLGVLVRFLASQVVFRFALSSYYIWVYLVERRRVELLTSALRMCEHRDASNAGKALTPTPSDACTSACTSHAENANAGDSSPDQRNAGEESDADPLARLAAAELAGAGQSGSAGRSTGRGPNVRPARPAVWIRNLGAADGGAPGIGFHTTRPGQTETDSDKSVKAPFPGPNQ